MEKLKIVYLKPGELTPYKHNARKHAEEDLATIRASIERFGFRDPIAVWGPKNIIVEGHGRQIVAKEMGLETVPVIRLDDMTDEQRRAYALAHNKTAEMSQWDFGKLDLELAGLNDFGMRDFGFGFGFTPAASGTETDEYQRQEDLQPIVNDEGFRDYQEPLSEDELKQYENNADEYLMRRRVIITFMPDQEEDIKQMLGISDEKMRIVYDFNELLGDKE